MIKSIFMLYHWSNMSVYMALLQSHACLFGKGLIQSPMHELKHWKQFHVWFVLTHFIIGHKFVWISARHLTYSEKKLMLVNRLSRLRIGLLMFIYSLVLQVLQVCNLLTEQDVHCPKMGCLLAPAACLQWQYTECINQEKKCNAKTVAASFSWVSLAPLCPQSNIPLQSLAYEKHQSQRDEMHADEGTVL